MARAFWKGAISFGLVYIPVEMYSAAQGNTIDLDYLDKRDFSPIGYQRYNKRTGKPVEWKNIVRGYQYQKGRYVALSEEDFRQANVKASQTIEITSFTEASSIAAEYYETPYYLGAQKGGQKVYALLREALKSTGKVGIATVVVRTRQHLAVLSPQDNLLMLNMLRFADELRSPAGLELEAPSAKTAGLNRGLLRGGTRISRSNIKSSRCRSWSRRYGRALTATSIETRVLRHRDWQLRSWLRRRVHAAPAEQGQAAQLLCDP